MELVADDVPYRMILSKTKAEIARSEATSPDLTIRGIGAAMSSLFLDRKPGGKMPPGVVVDGNPEALRALLAAFATTELEPAGAR